MFDIGASELLVIVIVAIIVIGPKDLPMALRTAGRWIGKVRRVSRHFQTGVEAMIREAELEDMEKKWKAQNDAIMARSGHDPSLGHDAAIAGDDAMEMTGPPPTGARSGPASADAESAAARVTPEANGPAESSPSDTTTSDQANSDAGTAKSAAAGKCPDSGKGRRTAGSKAPPNDPELPFGSADGRG